MEARALVDIAIQGSYLCRDYELRVTRRCLADDLRSPASDPFVDLANHEIIVALVNRRRDGPEDTRQVTPLSTRKTVYRLAYGDRHRGATWYDEANGVVWLLAYAQHEFGDTGDAFPYFKKLDADGQLLPTAEDYEALFDARDGRFAQVVAHECNALIEAARRSPGTEHRVRVAGQVEVGLVVESVESLEERTVAIAFAGLTQDNLPILLAALLPAGSADDLQPATSIAERVLTNELGFCALIET